MQATGHIEAGFALLAMNKPADAATSSNAALKALRSAQGAQGLAAIPLEALQGEFLLRTAQRDKGRQVMRERRAEVAIAARARCVDAVAVPARSARPRRA